MPAGPSDRLLEDDTEMTTVSRHTVRSKEERWMRDLRNHMQERMTTDMFGMLAAVLRKRIGAIDARHGEQAKWDTIMLKKDIQIACFSMIGIVASVIATTMFWYFGGKSEILLGDTNQDQRALLYIMQLAETFSTVVVICLIAQRYQLLLFNKRMEWSNSSMRELVKSEEAAKSDEERQKKDGQKDEPTDIMKRYQELIDRFESSYSFWKTSLRIKLAIEIFIHLLHPLIWMKVSSDSNVYKSFQILIFLRLYLGINLIFKFSSPYRRRLEIVANNAELQRTGFQPSVGGTIKIVFYDYPYLMTVVILIVSIVIFGFLIFITERSGNQPFANLESSMWFAFVTFSTTGYGDLVPTSVVGKLLACATGALGITVTTVFGGVVTNLMQQSREQRSISQYLEEIKADALLEDSAARVIQLAYRHAKMQSKDIVNPWVQGGHKSNVVYGSIKRFKSYRWMKSQTQNSTNDPVTDMKINHVLLTLHNTQRAMMSSSNTLKSTMASINAFTTEIRSIIDPALANETTQKGGKHSLL